MAKFYNLEYLEEISSGDQEFVRDMLRDFVNNTPFVLKEIDNQIAIEDWNQLYKTIHKFIPTFEFIGAAMIHNDLRSIEQFCKTQSNTEQINPLILNVKSYCDNVILEIKSDFNF